VPTRHTHTFGTAYIRGYFIFNCATAVCGCNTPLALDMHWSPPTPYSPYIVRQNRAMANARSDAYKNASTVLARVRSRRRDRLRCN
jgi:hypothetical protein